MKRTPADWLFLVALLLFAAGLRLVGIAYGQPTPQYNRSLAPKQMIHDQTPLHPDEYFHVTIPLTMLVTHDLNPHFFEYPSFMMNVNFLTFWLTDSANGISADDWRGVTSRSYAPFSLYVIARVYAVLGGLLVVAAAYGVAWRLVGRFAAVSAGMVMAVSYTLVQHAHYATQSSVSGGLAALAIWASIVCLQAKRPPLRLFILAGVASGFAAGCRYNVAAVTLVVFAVGCILIYRHRSSRVWRGVLIGWLAAPAAFLLSTPYAVLDYPAFMDGFRYLTGQYLSTATNIQSDFVVNPWYGLWVQCRYLVVFAMGVPATLAALVGIVMSWRTRPARQAFLIQNSSALVIVILLVYAIPYSLVVLRTLRPYNADHLLIPILPVGGILAGVGAGWLYEHLPVSRKLLAPGLIGALVIVPLSLSIPLDRLFSEGDTRYIVQAWIYQHVPRGSVVLLSGPYNVPLDAADYRTRQVFNNDILTPVDLQGVDYIIRSDASRFTEGRLTTTSDNYRQIEAFDDWLNRSFVRIAAVQRPQWGGYDWDLNAASYWHDPGLTVYCLTEASCAAVQG